ncbi:MAG: hypothetical protein EA403_01115 [Spirochaetaceae bacterium]|nr:MAG: hypothetical protein EA403_01115 [Spirochaetaceae bacterium]
MVKQLFQSIAMGTTLLVFGLAFPSTIGALTSEIRSIDGRVDVRLPGRQWQPAEIGMQIPVAGEISTSFGAEAVLALGDVAVLRVRPLTRMRVDELIERDGTVDSELFLQVGRVRGEVRSAEGLRAEFRLRSTQAVASVRGTDFEFDGTTLEVFSGLMGLANRFEREVSVSAAERSTVIGTAPPTRPLIERLDRARVAWITPGSPGEATPRNLVFRTSPATGRIIFDVIVE